MSNKALFFKTSCKKLIDFIIFNLKRSRGMEEQIIKSISINAKEIDAKYMERRKAVLEKHPDDIETPDLQYISMYDPIFSKLPFKFRRILQRSEQVKAIFG